MSSPEALLSPATPHSLPGRFALCDIDPKGHPLLTSSITSTPSLYVTFKVLQLVNTFRKRVKTRVQSARRHSSKKAKPNFCSDFEKEAFAEVDRYLGRKPVHSPGKRHKVAERTASTTTEQHFPNTSQWLVSEVDRAVKAGSHSLTTVASSERLFVQRAEEFTINAEHFSTQELTQLLVVVKDLLQTLKRLPSLQDRYDTTCEGRDLPPFDLDEACVANLEHLLLCLKDQLLRLLVAKLVKLVQKHIVDCQRDQDHHSAVWFCEYPNAQHPLSTTWPWSIRPSLAVLWGVCWMFYDHHDDNNNSSSSNNNDNDNRASPPRGPLFRWDHYGNMLNEQGQVIADSRLVYQYLSSRQQQHHGLHIGTARQAPMPRHRLPPQQQPAIPHSSAGGQIMAAPHFRGTTHSPSHSHHPSVTSGVAHAPEAFAIPATNNTYTAAPPAYDAGPAGANPAINWLPEDDFGTSYQPEASAFQADVNVNAWQPIQAQAAPEQQQQHQAAAFIYPHVSPPRSRNPLTPTISVTTDFHAFAGLQQPQDSYQSATPVTSASSLHAPPDPFNFTAYTHNPNQLSPQASSRFMNPEQREMQTPPRSPHPPGLVDAQSRKRSHSIMSGGGGGSGPGGVVPAAPSVGGGSRSASVASGGPAQSPGEDYSPRTRAFKRDDPPPMNAEHKYICTYAPECSALTFERKCEWSKHMDKHDRPYRCSHASCAKLQGFTYSGGLLRHEREVHGKHGGPKSQLMCPYQDCKRHSGKGFTRKENLNEHIRRVHQNKDEQSPAMPLKRDATDAFAGADELETPDGDAFDAEDQISPVRKRRRHTGGIDETDVPEDVEELKRQIRILHQQNEAKDAQIMDMQMRLDEEKQQRQEEMARMHDSMRQLQQQGQVPA